MLVNGTSEVELQVGVFVGGFPFICLACLCDAGVCSMGAQFKFYFGETGIYRGEYAGLVQ